MTEQIFAGAFSAGSPVALCVIRSEADELVMEEVSEAFAALEGMDRAQLTGRSFSALFSQQECPWTPLCDAALAGQTAVRRVFSAKTEKYLTVTAFPAGSGRAAFLVQDMTPMTTLVRQSLSDPGAELFFFDPEEKRAYLPRALRERFGAQEDCSGLTCAFGTDLTDTSAAALAAAEEGFIQGAECADAEVQLRDGRWLHLRVARDEGGVSGACLGYVEDVTERVNTRQIMEAIVNEGYDYIVRIDGRTRAYKAYSRSRSGILEQAREGEDFNEIARRVTEKEAAAADQADTMHNKRVENMLHHLAQEPFYEFNCPVVLDGKTLVKKYRCVLLDPERKVIMLTRTDVTEAVRHERQRVQTADIIGNLPAGIAILKKPEDGVLYPAYYSQSFLALCRMTAEDMGRTYREDAYAGVHPEDRERVRAAIESRERETQFTVPDYRLATGDGGYVWVSVAFRLRRTEDNERSYYAVYTDVTREHELKVELNAAQKRFDLALERSNILIWEYDLRRDRCIYSSKVAEQYLRPQVMDNYPECLFGGGTLDARTVAQYRGMTRRLKAGEDSVTETIHVTDPSGKLRWYSLDYTLERDEQGAPLRAIGCGYEVTEQMELKEKFNAQLAYRQNLSTHSLFSVRVDLDADRVLEASNADQWLRAALEREEPASAFLRFVCSGGTEHIRGRFEDCYDMDHLRAAYGQGDTQLSARYRCAHIGKCIELSVTTVRNPVTDHLEAFFVQQDVTQEQLMQTALHSISSKDYDYLGIIDVKSGSFTRLSGSEAEHLPESYYADYETAFRAIAEDTREHFITEEDYRAAKEDVVLAHVLHELADKETYGFNVSLRGRDGETHTSYVSYTFTGPERDQVLITRADVSHAVQEAERNKQVLAGALRAAEQASRAKSEFLSRMSHEIRTPMNAIIGITSLAAGDVEDPELIRDDLSKIGLSARYLLSLINDILDMSRIESGRVVLSSGPIAFEGFIAGINNIIYSQCAEKGIDYDAIVTGFVESAYMGDAVKLQQILVNILGNAVKFTPKGGKITLKIEQVRREADSAVLRFTVNDTGVGIDKDFLPHIFNAFEQEEGGVLSPYGGTGLGLAICKSMVEMMDGHIGVHSIKGVGSEFVVEVRLGVSAEVARQTALGQTLRLPVLETLVVDDDITVCQSTQKTLERMGLHSEWADSGLAAVARVKHRQETGKRFDLILLDWKMPGMDGIETAREIRRVVGPEVTIIIMTAYDWSQIEKAARAAGVNMFMQKPLFQSTLMSAFHKIYGGEKEQAAPAEKTYHLQGKHILLVEDHPLNVEVARRLLEKQGVRVSVANNGLAAIETFAQALPGTFAAILMDVRMPVMDGLTAAANIRQMKKEGSRTIPIIAMTANAFDEDIRKSRESGMDAHLAKPIDPQLLYATLEKFIEPLTAE